MRLVAALLGLIGVALIVVGIVYFTVPAHSLPGFLGQLHGINKHRSRRGEASVALGVICVILSAITSFSARRRPAAS
jgi:uncharacterized membrane protein HdeD (DUF308 family)